MNIAPVIKQSSEVYARSNLYCEKLLFFPSSRSSDRMEFADTKSHQILSKKPGNIGNDSKSAFPSFVEQLQFVKVAKTTKDNGWLFL